jgi:thiol-disulfide isomerase/thioredoxin
MKKLIFLFTVIALNFSCSAQENFSEAALSEKLINLEGNNTNLNRIMTLHKGKTVVIEVWASWCSDCVKNLPKIKEMQGTFTDVDFVFLSCDKDVEAWKKGIEKHQLNGDHFLIPEGMKGTFAKSINLTWIPRYIIIDKSGKIALYNAVETDNEKVYELLKSIK